MFKIQTKNKVINLKSKRMVLPKFVNACCKKQLISTRKRKELSSCFLLIKKMF